MTEQRRALCYELAQVEKLIDRVLNKFREHCGNDDPTWDHVNELREYKRRLTEMMEERR